MILLLRVPTQPSLAEPNLYRPEDGPVGAGHPNLRWIEAPPWVALWADVTEEKCVPKGRETPAQGGHALGGEAARTVAP